MITCVAITSILSGCSHSHRSEARQLEQSGFELIQDEPGGVIGEHMERRAKYIASEKRLALCGRNFSAATFFITTPGACSCADARFYFHGPAFRTGRAFKFREDFVRILYPHPALRAWYLEKASHLQGRDFARLTAQELAELGVLPLCQAVQ